MKKIIILMILLFAVLTSSCQNNKWQTINYNGVSVQIPDDWGNKNTVNNYDENFTEYQISCWSIDNESMFIIQWLDVEIESELYIETKIQSQRELVPTLKSFDYSKIYDADFLAMEAKKCHFSKRVDYDDSFEGEYYAFIKNKHSYILCIGGDKNFYKSADYNKILNSIIADFSGVTQPKEKKVQTTETSDTFTDYRFKEYSLSVPNTMELRDENSFMSLSKEIINDKIKNIKKIDIEDFNFVFQPAGTDDIEDSEQQKKALGKYARIMINYMEGENGDFMSWDDDITMPTSEYNELNKTSKEQTIAYSKQGFNNIKSIDDIKVRKNAYKWPYMKQTYIRTGLNGDVKVTTYFVHNNSEMVRIIISYRMSESNLWEKDFEKIIDTFRFNTKK